MEWCKRLRHLFCCHNVRIQLGGQHTGAKWTMEVDTHLTPEKRNTYAPPFYHPFFLLSFSLSSQ